MDAERRRHDSARARRRCGVYRTNAGLLTHTATIKGKPYGYTKLRATYKREVDAAGSFADWNSPDVVHDAESWIESGYKNDLTFNWFYIDDEQIAYFNSGANPVRARRTHPNFPVQGASRSSCGGTTTPSSEHLPARAARQRIAQVIDQRFLTSWNNKQAHGYRCDSIRCYTLGLPRRLARPERSGRASAAREKMSLTELIDAMENAGTVDLRGAQRRAASRWTCSASAAARRSGPRWPR